MSKRAIFAFGRMNPPTTGHERLIDLLLKQAIAHQATPYLFLSKTEDKNKNPLSYDLKCSMLKKWFPKLTIEYDKTIKTPIDVFRYLSMKNYNHVWMLAGSDRLDKYQPIVDRNKTRFETCELISAGERDPDADDVSGMSASKMRLFVKMGDYPSFRKGLPSPCSEKDALFLFDTLQNRLNENWEDNYRLFCEEFL